MGKSTISMVIFNSYVKLPEGIFWDQCHVYHPWLPGNGIVTIAPFFPMVMTRGCWVYDIVLPTLDWWKPFVQQRFREPEPFQEPIPGIRHHTNGNFKTPTGTKKQSFQKKHGRETENTFLGISLMFHPCSQAQPPWKVQPSPRVAVRGFCAAGAPGWVWIIRIYHHRDYHSRIT